MTKFTLNLLLLLSFPFIFLTTQSLAGTSKYNILSFGAKGDGKTDSTKPLLAAWDAACGSDKPSVIHVPHGNYLIGAARFEGKCNNERITIRVDGTLVAPSDYSVIGNSGKWLHFDQVDGVTIRGGILDGQGTHLWACKASGVSCPIGATTLTFSDSNNIMIAGTTSLNSQLFHIGIIGCQNVKLHGLKIKASGTSPNTDGIHIQQSSGVSVLHSRISTGDDCISMGPGTSNVFIEKVSCGPGHGISIGSLGWDLQEEGVQNVTAKSVTFTGTQNGFRIKTWGRDSNSFVKNVLFQNAIMVNVENPLLIDQNYCPNNKDCPGQLSGVKISDVKYVNIHGTSATQVAVKFDCSKKNPCTEIKLDGVKLKYMKDTAVASCVNAGGTSRGQVEPASCLS